MKTLLGSIIFLSLIFIVGSAEYCIDNYPIESLCVCAGGLIMTAVICMILENRGY